MNKKKTPSHSPEPWLPLIQVCPNPEIPRAKETITECCGSVLMNADDYERARICVNACKGMDNPEQVIDDLREISMIYDEMRYDDAD